MVETDMVSDVYRPRVFVSYSREDGAFAGRLALILNDKGFEAAIDREDVEAEEIWKARVRPLILSSDLVIVILTAKSAALDSVRWEADLAAGSGKRIVVVVPTPLEDGIVLSPPLSLSPSFHFYPDPARAESGIYAGPALEKALNADLAWRRQYTRLLLLAEKWKDQDRADELLLRGEALTTALSWRASIPRGQTLVPVVADFLAASEQAEARCVEPTGAFESTVLHLDERRRAAQEAARASEATRARRDEGPLAFGRTLTPTQLANVPLAPVHAPMSLRPSPSAGREDPSSNDASPDDASPGEDASRRKLDRGTWKGLGVPALVVLLMFAGSGVVVWQVVPQYLTARDAEALPLQPANPAGSEAPAVALAESSEPAPTPPEVSPEPAPPIQAATAPATPKAVAAEPAAAADPSPEEADWLAARHVGTMAAFRTYMLKWPKGSRHDQALSAAKRRIKTLSTKPESTAVLLPGPLVYRELPTFRDKGAAEGVAGQAVNFMDRIASPKEGEWLVLEREGAWPFRFVSAREIESMEQ